MYTALVLDEPSKKRLIKRFVHIIPYDWDIVKSLHMTINMGEISKGPADEKMLLKNAELTVVSVAADDKVIAVGVESDIPSKNAKKHVTIAVNREKGGKPVMSNSLTNWVPLPDQFDLFGTIQEMGKH